jgi:hypothetical protein
MNQNHFTRPSIRVDFKSMVTIKKN